MSGDCMPKEQYEAIKAMQEYLLELTNMTEEEALNFAFRCWQLCDSSKFIPLLNVMHNPKSETSYFENVPIAIFSALEKAWTVDKSLTEGVGQLLSYDPEEKTYYVCDNKSNEFFVEGFSTIEEAVAWLFEGGQGMKIISEDANKSIQERKQDTAPHQSEVHVHREYVLLAEFSINNLELKVNEYLGKGYTLYGNLLSEADWNGDNYRLIQAMVRGI